MGAVTVDTSTISLPTGPCRSRKLAFAAGLWWLWDIGTNNQYWTSSDGITWGNRTIFTTGAVGNTYDVFVSGTKVYYARITANANTAEYRTGTLQSNSTITWDAAEQVITFGGAIKAQIPCIRPDSLGNLWLSFEDTNTNPSTINVWTNKSSSWAASLTPKSIVVSNLDGMSCLFTYTAGKMGLYWSVINGGGASATAGIFDYDGTNWGSNIDMTISGFPGNPWFEVIRGSGFAIGDTFYWGGTNTDSGITAHMGFFKHASGSTSVPVPVVYDTNTDGTIADPHGTLSSDGGSSNFWVFYSDTTDAGATHGPTVFFVKSTDGGTTWTSRATFDGLSNELYIKGQTMISSDFAQAGKIGVAWSNSNNGVSPNNVRFDTQSTAHTALVLMKVAGS